jgi:HD-like signal output (HDOD) protein
MAVDPADLLKRHLDVPSLPKVCTRLNEAVNNPRSSTLDIADIISEDAALTARLLRLVNSSFYGFPSTIETPSQAVMIVGTTHLCDLALTTSVMRLFRGIPREFVTMDSFWRHSIACGLAARVLAAHRHEPNLERFFVAGVLHDIGRLLIYQQTPELARAAIEKSIVDSALLFDAEREALGCDHGALGGALLRAWSLSASLEESVAYHHRPTRARRYPVEAALVHVADVIAQALELGSSGDRYVPPVEPEAWAVLELPVSVVGTVVEEVERQFADVTRAILPDTGA